MRLFARISPVLWQRLTLLLVLCAALLLSHPFTGIRHDGTLYAGEALARILPGNFHDDIYFQYGSQGRFTLFPAYYAALISGFGVGLGTIVGLLIAYALYLAAAFYLIAALAPRPFRFVCLLSVLLGWAIYGGTRVFAYSEPFLTARSYAEPVVLLGLGLLIRGRIAASVLALLIALALHPLIAIAGVLVAWLHLVQQHRRWLIAAALALLVTVSLGVMQVGPFDDLFSRYDDVWLRLVREANPQAFFLQWSVLDYGIIVFDIAVLWFARTLTPEALQRKFVVAAAVAGFGATIASLLLVDMALNPFFGKLQIWRAGWIMQWVAMAVFPLVIAALWRRGEHGRVAAGLLVMAWMAPFSYAPALLAMMALAVDGLGSRITVTRTTTRIVLAVVVIEAITITVQHEVRAWTFGLMLHQGPMQMAGQALGLNLLLAAILYGFMRAMPRLGRTAPLIALLLLAGAASLWDQRSPWTRTLESYVPGKPLWSGLIEPDAKVYWYRDLIAPWVLLGHANYYTPQQNSGAVFSRDMTIELDKRSRLTGLLDLQEQICRLMNNLNGKQTSCEPDAAAVREVCKAGGIDYVVLQSRLEGNTPLAEATTGIIEENYEKKFFLYRCSALN